MNPTAAPQRGGRRGPHSELREHLDRIFVHANAAVRLAGRGKVAVEAVYESLKLLVTHSGVPLHCFETLDEGHRSHVADTDVPAERDAIVTGFKNSLAHGLTHTASNHSLSHTASNHSLSHTASLTLVLRDRN